MSSTTSQLRVTEKHIEYDGRLFERIDFHGDPYTAPKLSADMSYDPKEWIYTLYRGSFDQINDGSLDDCRYAVRHGGRWMEGDEFIGGQWLLVSDRDVAIELARRIATTERRLTW